MSDPIATHPDRAGMTVVMITRNRRREAQLAVRRLLDLPDSVDVIVVDNGAGDGGPDLREFPAQRIPAVELGENLGAAGRNVGARMASTRYVAFADDDSS